MKHIQLVQTHTDYLNKLSTLAEPWVIKDELHVHFMPIPKVVAAWEGGGQADAILNYVEPYSSVSPLKTAKSLTSIAFPAEATSLLSLDSTHLEGVDLSKCKLENPIILQVKELTNSNVVVITPTLYEVEIWANLECTERPTGTYNLKTDYNTKPLYIKLNIPYENALYYCELNNYANKFVSSTNSNIYFKIGLYSKSWEGPSPTFCNSSTKVSKVSEGLYKFNGTYGSDVTITFSQESDCLLGKCITSPNYVLPSATYWPTQTTVYKGSSSEVINATMFNNTAQSINVGPDLGDFIPTGYIKYDATYNYYGQYLDEGPRIELISDITKLILGTNIQTIKVNNSLSNYNFFDYGEITGTTTKYLEPGNELSKYVVTNYILHHSKLLYIAIPEGLSIPSNFIPSTVTHIDYQGSQTSWNTLNISIPSGCTISYNVSIT